MAEFDKFGSDYKTVLNRDIRFSGENAEYFARYKAEFVARYLGSNFKGRILDYGCGVGLVLKLLRSYFDRHAVDIVGFDIAASFVEDACKNIDDVKFICNFQEIKQDNFDVIIMANVLHHIKPQDRDGFMNNALTFLREGGSIIIFEHNPYNPATRMIVKLSPIDKGVSLLTLKDNIKLLHRSKINVCETQYIVFFPRILKMLRFLEPMMGRIPLGAQYVCIGSST